MRFSRLLALVLSLAAAGTAQAQPLDGYRWQLPSWLPPLAVPADNPMSEAKVDLGRHLFYDKRLSVDGSMSCSSCHQQARALTEDRATSIGVTGELHPRNAMSLANVAYHPVLTWANPLLMKLEHQALVPMFGESPVEMGLAGHEQVLFERLGSDPTYPAKFREAFPERGGAIDLGTITKALAAFQRTIVSADSAYDRYRYGGREDAISPSTKRGETLFFSERLECFHCHGGVHLTDSLVHSRKPFAEFAFHNTGLYNRDGSGGYPSDNLGLIEHTGRPADMGRFRTPSLRNVAVTGPYMHDGSIERLEDVIRYYARGGRAASALTSPFLPGFSLNDDETADLIAFLKSLTDDGFLSDARFSDPWQAELGARGNDGK